MLSDYAEPFIFFETGGPQILAPEKVHTKFIVNRFLGNWGRPIIPVPDSGVFDIPGIRTYAEVGSFNHLWPRIIAEKFHRKIGNSGNN